MTKVEIERHHFAEGVVEKIEREVDIAKVLEGNALFQRLKPKSAPKPEPAEA